MPLVIPGTTHGLRPAPLLVQVLDTSSPRRLVQLPTQVTPSTADVTLSFLQAQAGTVLLAATLPRFTQSFAAATSWSAPGATHSLGTAALIPAVYDSAGVLLPFVALTVDSASPFNVTVTFAQAQAGTLLLSAAPGFSQSFTSATSWSLPASTHGQGTNVQVALWSAATPRVALTGGVTVAANGDVTCTFAQAQAGTLVVQPAPVALAFSVSNPLATTTLVASRLAATTLTPTSATTSARGMSTQAAAASLTPSTALTITRTLTATILGASTTPGIATVQPRFVTSTLVGLSATSALLSTQTRALQGNLRGESRSDSPTVDILILYNVLAQVGVTSLTPASTTLMTRQVQAQLLAPSLTSTTGTTAARRLTAAVAGLSVTPSSQMVHSRPLTAALLQTTSTPAAGAQEQRTLIASVLTPSTTALAGATSLRPLTTALVGTTTTSTPAAFLTGIRALTARISGSSVTTASGLTTARSLTTALAGASQTPLAGSTQTHPITSMLRSPSATPAALTLMQRTLMTGIQSASTTPAASAFVTDLRACTAALAGSSLTPPVAIPLVQRQMLAQPGAVSLTSALAAPIVQRQVLTALPGISQTPASAGVQLRQTAARLNAPSLTAAATFTVLSGRQLISFLLGQTVTTVTLAQQQHLLSAKPTGPSFTPSVASGVQRPLVSRLIGAGNTPASAVGFTRSLNAQGQAQSLTPMTNAMLLRRLQAALTSPSQTVVVHHQIVRGLMATGSVLTSTAPAILGQVRFVTTSLRTASLTTTLLMTMGRSLQTDLIGATASPGLSLLETRTFAVLIAQPSVTPSAGSAVIRPLHAVLSGTTSVSPIHVELVRDVILAARFRATSITTDPAVTQTLAFLSAYLAGTSVTRPAHRVIASTLVRIEYPTEVHYVRPGGGVVKIVQKRRVPPPVRRYVHY